MITVCWSMIVLAVESEAVKFWTCLFRPSKPLLLLLLFRGLGLIGPWLLLLLGIFGRKLGKSITNVLYNFKNGHYTHR